MSARSSRSRSRPDRTLAYPLSRTRARVDPDGAVELSGGPCVRLGPAARTSGRRAALGSELPLAEWSETHARFSFRHSAFAGVGCAFERVEIENPFREARDVKLRAEIALPPDTGRVRMAGSVLRGGRGEALVAFSGAEVSQTHLPGPGGGNARVDLHVVIPPRGRRVVETALGPVGGRARARSFTRELNATRARWDDLLGGLGSASVPDEVLADALARALPSVAGSLAPSASVPEALWPRPGFPPAQGPATLDAVALRALDLWGGARLVDRCLFAAFDAQGTAAPPGEHFRCAAGHLSAPTDSETRERWASDCGALLWVAACRRDVGVPARVLREARPHLVAACEWIMGELGPDGLMPRARAPRGLGKAGRAWTDGWSWRGLDAAARELGSAGHRAAKRIGNVADAYRARILDEWGGDPAACACLETLHLLERDDGPARPRDLVTAAAAVVSGRLGHEAEVREAAIFLLGLRKLLVDDSNDEGKTLRLFPEAPGEWFEGGRAPGFERLPTRFGPVSVRAISTRSARRVIAEVDLPALPRGAAVELRVGPPPGTSIKEVRVDGRRSSRFRPRVGAIGLPPRRSLEVVAELSG